MTSLEQGRFVGEIVCLYDRLIVLCVLLLAVCVLFHSVIFSLTKSVNLEFKEKSVANSIGVTIHYFHS